MRDDAGEVVTGADRIEMVRFYLVVIVTSVLTVAAWSEFAIEHPRVSLAALVVNVLLLYRWERWIK